MYRSVGKRILDLILTAPALLLLSPVLCVVAILILVLSGFPVFFLQRRPGLHGRPFTLVKFRTMNQDRDATGNLLADAERLSSLGRLLRSTSLDELPELFNVLRGEMSLVGPRPLLMEYLDRYNSEQSRRHNVMPGITGWAQVNGRNAVSWEQRFELDVWYVNHCSMWLDLKILIKTVLQVLRRQGISQEGHVTMSNFMGTARTDNNKHEGVPY